jgi:hypothetical protein
MPLEAAPQVSVSLEAVPWLWWTFAALMILLQLIILVLIAGRPSAVAVIGVTLPFLCGVCALTATALILNHIHVNTPPPGSGGTEGDSFATHPHYLIPLLYMIWAICGIVGLTSVVLSIVMLRRGVRVPAPAAGASPPDKPSQVTRSPHEAKATP